MTGLRGEAFASGPSAWFECVRLLGLRLGPEEELLAELTALLETSQLPGLTIVTAAGSLRDAKFGTAALTGTGAASYSESRRVSGAIELVSLAGHIGSEEDGCGAPHVHAALALEDATVVGGHLFEAHVLGTVEVTLVGAPGLAWEGHRVMHDGVPYPTHVLTAGGRGAE